MGSPGQNVQAGQLRRQSATGTSGEEEANRPALRCQRKFPGISGNLFRLKLSGLHLPRDRRRAVHGSHRTPTPSCSWRSRRAVQAKDRCIGHQRRPNLSRTYSRLRDEAGLPCDLVLYLARHECGTKVCRQKGIEFARRLLGHANISTTQRYMRLDDQELADAQDLVE